jgi:DNA-binding protein H-NS
MAKIDLDALSIEELAALRDEATEKLAEKVAARQAELEAELAMLSRYGKIVKKTAAGPETKSSKPAATRDDATKDSKDPAVKAA